MIRQLVRFLGVGVVATFTHAIVALLANGIFNFPAQAANFTGFCTAFCVSYFGHTIITFQIKKNHKLYLPKFIVVTLFGLLISSAITYLVTEKYGMRFEIAMLLVVICVPAMTFLASKFWAFAEADTGSEEK